MANKSTVSLGIDNLLEDRQMLSVAPVPPLDNFRDPTATIRVLDQAQQNIVGVTREGRSAIADAFFTQGMGYGWQMSHRINGEESNPGYGTNVLGNADTVGYGREGSPEVVRVTPSFTLEVINNNQLKVTWMNMNTTQGACWFRGGWLGDRIIWNADGTTTINVPYTSGDPKFDQIGFEGPWGSVWTGITFRIQQGHFTQVPTASSYTFASWAGWNRTLPNDDVDFAVAESLNGDKTIGNVTLHTHEVLVHPGKSEDAVLTWTSQAAGTASIQANLQDARVGMGDGVTYTIQRIKADGTETTTLRSGVINDGGNLAITEGALSVAVGVGDKIKVIFCAKGTSNDPDNNKWDSIRVCKLEVKLTEAEKTYEKVTVAPSIQLRTGTDNHSLMIDYRNMPEGVTLRAVARDHYQQTRELSLPMGTGSSWLNLNGMEPTSVVGVDVYLVHSRSEGEPVQEKKMTFQAQLGPDIPTIVSIPSTREYFGLLAQDVLKQAGMTKTNTDLEEEYAFLQYQEEIMKAPPARDWTEGKTFSIYTQEQNFGLHQFRWGPLVGNGGVYSTMYVIDGTKFNRFRVRGSQSADLLELDYFVKDGIKKVPHTCTERLADGSIVLKPVGLGHVIVKVRLNGTYSGGLYGSADNIDTLRPIEGQFIDGGIVQLRAQLADPQYEGFQSMITEVQEARSPVLLPGTAVQMICQFESKGTQGGPVSFKVTCGYTGDPNVDSVQCVVDKVFSTTDIKSFIKNVYAPNNPPTPQSRPIITVELTYADGRKQIVGQRISRAPTLNAEDQAYNKRRFDQIVAAQSKLPMVDEQGNTIGIGGVLFTEEQRIAYQQHITGLMTDTSGNVIGLNGNLFTTIQKAAFSQRYGDLKIVSVSDRIAFGGELLIGANKSTTSILNIPASGRIDPEYKSLRATGEHNFQVTVPWNAMANFWINPLEMGLAAGTNSSMGMNFSLKISGGDLSKPYESDKSYTSGESVSLRLTPGQTYTVTVRDKTVYNQTTVMDPAILNSALISFKLNMNVKPYDNRDISGRISVPEKNTTMPVRMRVAEFIGSERRELAVNHLDTSKPVWVVIHGMNSGDDKKHINDLASALTKYSSSLGVQVVTIDWSDAAVAAFGSTTDAPWTAGVGKWVAQQLIGMGFDASKINGIGHSHGTYALYEMAARIMELSNNQQMNALVALDPAQNYMEISGYNHGRINFSDVSRNSISLEGSVFGLDDLAGTADVAIKINTTNTIDPFIRHSLPVSVFTKMLEQGIANPGKFLPELSLGNIMMPSSANHDQNRFKKDQYDSRYEGVIDVEAINTSPNEWQANIAQMAFKDAYLLQDLIDLYNE